MLQKRWVRAGLPVLSGVLIALNVGATEISVKASLNAYAGKLQNDALLHGNRSYSYRYLPKELLGFDYTLHDHKAPSALQAAIEKGGKLYLALFEQTRPERVVEGLPWEVLGTAGSTAGSEAVSFYKTVVATGQSFTFKSVDKWGAILGAENISGLQAAPKKPAIKVRPEQHNPALPLSEFSYLQKQIVESRQWNQARLEREALSRDALMLETDKTPLDIVLRRPASWRKLRIDGAD